MPWRLSERDGKWCVIKETDGSVEKCHDSRTKALRHQRALYANEPSMKASVYDDYITEVVDVTEDGYVTVKVKTTSLTAAVAPLKPPREWFEMPEASEPTPLTFTADGRVYGHLASGTPATRA
jgi:hypothetical protein